MVDSFSHGGMVTIPAIVVNEVCKQEFGFQLFDFSFLLMLAIGSIAPDVIGEPLVWIASHINRKKKGIRSRVPWYKPWEHYSERLTKELKYLDEEYPKLFVPYWLLHSYWSVVPITLCFYFLYGWWIALAWFVGHVLHVVVDRYTHEVSRPYYPFPTQRVSGAKRDWWRSDVYQHLTPVITLEIPTVYLLVVPMDFAAIYHLAMF